MNVIARWWVVTDRNGEHAYEVDQTEVGAAAMAQTLDGKVVGVVPASQLRGAVEALQVIAENRIPGGYAESVPRTVQAYAQGALSRLGGRYDRT